jgi:hypothetical protein
VDVVNELPPAEHLPEETLLAGQRYIQADNITNHSARKKAMHIHER